MFLPTEGEPALLVIDAQRAHTNPRSSLHCKDVKTTIENINRLITAFKAERHPVVYIRHEHGRDGSDLGRMWGHEGEAPGDFPFKTGTNDVEYAKELERVSGCPEVVKNRHDAFEDTALKHTLDEVNADHVVITGFMTHLCCEATARHAHDLDYAVTFIPDATGSPDLGDGWPQKRVREAVSALMAAGVAKVMDSAKFLETDLTA